MKLNVGCNINSVGLSYDETELFLVQYACYGPLSLLFFICDKMLGPSLVRKNLRGNRNMTIDFSDHYAQSSEIDIMKGTL